MLQVASVDPRRVWLVAGLVVGLGGCVDRAGDTGGGSDEAADPVVAWGEGPVGDSTGAPPEQPDPTGGAEGEPWGATGDDCGTFLGCNDVPEIICECDFWGQDCVDGEKCAAVPSTPGSDLPDAYVCVPAGEGALGDPCTLVDGPVGADSCGVDARCLGIDPSTGVGRCVGVCLAPESEPGCADPEATCRRTDEYDLDLCLPSCDPLLPGSCANGDACVAFEMGAGIEDFICYPPAEEGLSGDPCECVNCCAAGHACVSATQFGPDCSAGSCCTEYCDVTDPQGACPGLAQSCVALFEAGTSDYDHVGRCEVVP